MLQRTNLIWLLGTLLLVRIIAMVVVPLADTTEPRYAEIARLMLTTNDWITPWFEPDVPFWGKPPLSFWAQALSFKLFGINEFAGRLPALLAFIATAWMLWRMAVSAVSAHVAAASVVVYSSMLLTFLAAGTVMTDPYLALGTTWAMVAFYLAPKENVWYWRYGVFIGLGIGLLAKGPLAIVIAGAPIGLWVLFQGKLMHYLRTMPWIRGTLLTLLIALPWYILAELKTPGFINYFIVGEHFMRFVDPGWMGDLYGHAHKEAKGMIWLHWLAGSTPWGPLALLLLVGHMLTASLRKTVWHALKQPVVIYALLWALVTPVFFTAAGNVIWTYVLPSMPAFALLMGWAIVKLNNGQKWRKLGFIFVMWFMPIAGLIFSAFIANNNNLMKTEKTIAEYVAQQPQIGDNSNWSRLYYLAPKLEFSARFYSHDKAKPVKMGQLENLVMQQQGVFLAVPTDQWETTVAHFGARLEPRIENMRFKLAFLKP
ncbi:ArnT family glycosyltransferase [Candidatus Njordibacter sp. Uisw_002]|uniref:ArnT family glycosyltransferase n=1 Tax=Candidatus Njordibacter sp. Uisw_002 TaxID=3230971 RepID=UPI003D5680F8|tara:strand:+ start:1602 stop:3053 length:1452 start_codon:yes stop_codon:yes gene_type:complete